MPPTFGGPSVHLDVPLRHDLLAALFQCKATPVLNLLRLAEPVDLLFGESSRPMLILGPLQITPFLVDHLAHPLRGPTAEAGGMACTVRSGSPSTQAMNLYVWSLGYARANLESLLKSSSPNRSTTARSYKDCGTCLRQSFPRRPWPIAGDESARGPPGSGGRLFPAAPCRPRCSQEHPGRSPGYTFY